MLSTWCFYFLGIFGSDLSVLCKYQGTTIPKFFAKFIYMIEEIGLDLKDIYNTYVDVELVENLRESVEKGNTPND